MSDTTPGSGIGSVSIVRLVAAREITTRLRDRAFLISTAVLLLLIVGVTVFQVAVNSGGDKATIGVVGAEPVVSRALKAQGTAADTEVTVRSLADESAARAAVRNGDVDAVVLDPERGRPRVVVERPGGNAEALIRATVTTLAVTRQLEATGVTLEQPAVQVVALQTGAADRSEAIAVAAIGVGLLYFLLILFGQFVAQGVVEEKSSRVVELLLATMRPWQLLAGKVIGLGALGLAQILILAVVGGGGALLFDVVSVPGQLIGTVVTVVAWFVVGYAFYASVFAAAASLVSRQEDLGNVVLPMSLVLVAGFVIALQAVADPGSTLATVTSFVPGLSPLVMPVRMAAGEAAAWEVAVSVVLMLVAIALVVRLGGRIYAGALLRTGGKVKVREALAAGRG
jgi:ABC-2 type transport system permease protein